MIQVLHVLLPALALAGGAPAAIRVGEIAISRESIAERAKELREAKVPFKPEQLVEALVDEAALATEARRVGLDRDPDVRAAVEVEVSRLLAEHVVNTELTRAVKPTEERLKELFHQTGDSASMELVVLATQAEAEAARARLEQGGEFALEAARSLDPNSARNKGRTGQMTRMQVNPALAKHAFSESLGKIFGPVELRNGWAVARVVERTIGDDAAYAARRPALLPMAQKQALASARDHFVTALRKKSAATVDERFLESLGKRVDASPQELDTAFATINGVELKYRELQPTLRRFAAGQASSHMLGGPVKVQMAWTIVDNRLIATEARARGVDKNPALREAFQGVEIRTLASAMAARIGAAQPGETSPADRNAAVHARIKKLRAELEVRVDQKAALASASETREGSAGK